MKRTLCFILSLIFFLNIQPLNTSAIGGEDATVTDVNSMSTKTADLPIEIKAKSALLMDVETGTVLLE